MAGGEGDVVGDFVDNPLGGEGEGLAVEDAAEDCGEVGEGVGGENVGGKRATGLRQVLVDSLVEDLEKGRL